MPLADVAMWRDEQHEQLFFSENLQGQDPRVHISFRQHQASGHQMTESRADDSKEDMQPTIPCHTERNAESKTLERMP